MSQALRLFDPANQNRDSLYFERRRSIRRKIAGSVSAMVREPSEADDKAMGRVCALKLRDISDTGLGAFAQRPMVVGSSIAVFFPPHGHEPGYDLVGTVVRCNSTDDRHDIGISFSSTSKRAG